MSKRPGHLTTVIVEKETLRTLKHLARKDQTYDQLINELMKLKNVSKSKENSEDGNGIGTPAPSSELSKVVDQ